MAFLKTSWFISTLIYNALVFSNGAENELGLTFNLPNFEEDNQMFKYIILVIILLVISSPAY